MTNRELAIELERRIKDERQATNEILRLINLALDRRAYLELGYSSMFDWLVRGFNYSNAAAFRRIEAARLLRAVPEVESKLITGELNLTSASKAQSILRAEEKRSGKKVERSVKAGIVKKIENKSSREAEQTLFQIFPQAAESVQQERRTVVNSEETRLHLNLPADVDADLQRAKEVLSHSIPNGETAQVLGHVLKFFLDEKDPLRKSPSKSEVQCALTASRRTTPSAAEGMPQQSPNQLASNKPKPPSKAGVRRAIIQSTQARCSFRDPVTGRICGSRHQLQIDHIVPRALGGTDDPWNLRALCRPHNIHSAEEVFGREFISQFRRLQA